MDNGDEGSDSEIINVGSVQDSEEDEVSRVSGECSNDDATTTAKTSRGSASVGTKRKNASKKLATRRILDFFNFSGCDKESVGRKQLKVLKVHQMPISKKKILIRVVRNIILKIAYSFLPNDYRKLV